MTITDQVNRKIKRETDGLGRLVRVTEQDSTGALTQQTSYSYDLMDRLIEVNQGGQLRAYKYDDLGRLLYERIPEQAATISDATGGMWTSKYSYTDFNEVATKTDARGVITTYSYDSLNRLTQISYNTAAAPAVAATPAVSYSYDNAATSATRGLPLRVNVGSVYSESYGYDGFNRVSTVSETISGRSYTTSYQYNTASQATRLSYPSGRAINISHDSLGRIAAISNNADGTNYLSAVTYNGAGQVSGWKLGSNIVETMSYSADRMQMIGQKVTQNGAVRMSLSYSYQGQAGQNGAGSTAGNTGQMMRVSGSLDGQSESASYSYDLQGRLVTSTQTTGGVSAQRRYSYDRWGNRTAVRDAVSGGSLIQSISLQQSGGAPTNRIESVTSNTATLSYSYDGAGNVISDGQHSYQYDAENRLVSVDAAATASYSYDHHNRRVKKAAAAATTHYIWEGEQVIAEHDGISAAAVKEYVYAGSRMLARESAAAGREYLLYDRLSVRAVITDGQGSITGRQSHLPFGEQLTATGAQEKHRFTSYERDTETGLDYAVNRVYSPAVGRFLQADPYRASGGANDPQSWNRYAYTRNDPVNKVDLLGLEDEVIRLYGWAYMDRPGFGGGTGIPTTVNHGRQSQSKLGGAQGGGSTQQGPPNIPRIDPVPGDFERGLIRNAIDLALLALALKPDCRNLFASNVNPVDLLTKISRGSASGSITTGLVLNDQGYIASNTTAETKPTFQYKQLPNGQRVNAGTNGGIVTINVLGPFFVGYPSGWLGPNVSQEISRAVTIIHELGHVADYAYRDPNASSIDTSLEGQPPNRTSQQNSQLVYDKCFK